MNNNSNQKYLLTTELLEKLKFKNDKKSDDEAIDFQKSIEKGIAEVKYEFAEYSVPDLLKSLEQCKLIISKAHEVLKNNIWKYKDFIDNQISYLEFMIFDEYSRREKIGKVSELDKSIFAAAFKKSSISTKIVNATEEMAALKENIDKHCWVSHDKKMKPKKLKNKKPNKAQTDKNQKVHEFNREFSENIFMNISSAQTKEMLHNKAKPIEHRTKIETKVYESHDKQVEEQVVIEYIGDVQLIENNLEDVEIENSIENNNIFKSEDVVLDETIHTENNEYTENTENTENTEKIKNNHILNETKKSFKISKSDKNKKVHVKVSPNLIIDINEKKDNYREDDQYENKNFHVTKNLSKTKNKKESEPKKDDMLILKKEEYIEEKKDENIKLNKKEKTVSNENKITVDKLMSKKRNNEQIESENNILEKSKLQKDNIKKLDKDNIEAEKIESKKSGKVNKNNKKLKSKLDFEGKEDLIKEVIKKSTVKVDKTKINQNNKNILVGDKSNKDKIIPQDEISTSAKNSAKKPANRNYFTATLSDDQDSFLD